MASVRGVLFALQDMHYVSGRCIITEITSGTSSKVFFIDDYEKRYILKLNSEAVIQLEVQFLKRYEGIRKFPNVVTTDNKTYFLMEYKQGKMIAKDYSKIEMLNHINFMNQYEYSDSQVGYMNHLLPDFKAFLKHELEIEQLIIDDYFDIEQLFEKLEAVKLPEESPMYVHGDFGYHNLIMHNGELAIIDPTPMQNLILYELLFLYFSSPRDINEASFKAYYEYYLKYGNIDYSDFKTYAQIILALRLSTSTRHHPEDSQVYEQLLNCRFWDE